MFTKKLKKRISLLLAVLLVATTGALNTLVYALDTSLICAINSANFPDDNFRAVVADWYDDNGDGYLSSSEAKVSVMTLSFLVEDICGEGAKVSDLKGIEFFGGLQRLRASGLGISKLDVSQLTNLVELTVQGNELTNLDISRNTKLESLNCSSNMLTNLDISKNTNLTKVHAYVNKLTSLTFNSSANAALTELLIHQNELTSLNVSALTNLTLLNCSHNHLTSLDLSSNTKLETVNDSTIGHQQVSATARLDNGNIFVHFIIPNWNSKLVSTTVDRIITSDEAGTYTQLGYDGIDFTPQDCDEIVNGITYYYNVGLPEAEDMDVNVDVERNFWQVKYFTDESMTTMFDKKIVFNGDTAVEPTDIGMPQCKRFVSWSESSENITEDKNIYAKWADNHNIVVQKYEGGLFFFDCTKCRNQKSDYDFVEYVNHGNGDGVFVSILDQNHDDVINAKDYAMLIRALKK